MYRPLKIYVAGNYGRSRGLSEKDCEHNVRVAELAAQVLINKGHYPFVPHLYHWLHKGWENSPSEDVWGVITSIWIPCCDALLQLNKPPDKESGVFRETEMAEALGMPIFYSLEEVPNADSAY